MKKYTVDEILSIAAGIAGTILSATLRYPIPLGLFVALGFMFRKLLGRDPFKLSIDELRGYLREAVELERTYERELEDLQRIKMRIEKGELKTKDTTSLDLRIKHLEELLKITKSKKLVTEAIIMVRENVEVYKKLLGERDFDKLVSNLDELAERVNEFLKKEDIGEIDYEAVAKRINELIPLVIKEPEKYRQETTVEEKKQEKVIAETKSEEKQSIETREVVSQETLLDLLEEGTVKQWIDILEKASRESTKIRLPRGVYRDKEGYKNLLKALCVVDLGVRAIRKIIDDRALIRMSELFGKLKDEKTLELDPWSSDKDYIEDVLQIISGKIGERIEDNTKVELYRIDIPDLHRSLVVEKRVLRDPLGRATKIIYRSL